MTLPQCGHFMSQSAITFLYETILFDNSGCQPMWSISPWSLFVSCLLTFPFGHAYCFLCKKTYSVCQPILFCHRSAPAFCLELRSERVSLGLSFRILREYIYTRCIFSIKKHRSFLFLFLYCILLGINSQRGDG
jgi:hypothetical protein